MPQQFFWLKTRLASEGIGCRLAVEVEDTDHLPPNQFNEALAEEGNSDSTMAPMSTEDTEVSINNGSPNGHVKGSAKLRREPLKNSGSIDHLEYTDVSPIIGREYSQAKIKDILHAPNAEQQLRDLAITICERGVVFFRAPQDDLTVGEQKHVTNLLGKLTGRPKENGLHVHPLYNDPNNIPMADGTTDPNMYALLS